MNDDIEKISLETAIKRIKYTIKYTEDSTAQRKLYDVVFLLQRVDRIKD